MGLLMNVASATTRIGCQITLDGFVKGKRSAVVVPSMFQQLPCLAGHSQRRSKENYVSYFITSVELFPRYHQYFLTYSSIISIILKLQKILNLKNWSHYCAHLLEFCGGEAVSHIDAEAQVAFNQGPHLFYLLYYKQIQQCQVSRAL